MYVPHTHPFHRPAEESHGTKTRRREIRASVRRTLGTSSDPAPSLDQALLAADQLKRLVDLASGGRYGLAVVRLVASDEQGQHYNYRGDLSVSTQIHEPIWEALKREKNLREIERLAHP